MAFPVHSHAAAGAVENACLYGAERPLAGALRRLGSRQRICIDACRALRGGRGAARLHPAALQLAQYPATGVDVLLAGRGLASSGTPYIARRA